MTIRTRLVVLAGFVFAGASSLVVAGSPVALFRAIEAVPERTTKLEQDTRQLFRSTVDVSAIALMPESISVEIPRPEGTLTANVRLESMDRREGFAERDGFACSDGDITACEIIPIPDFPENEFSYTWVGQGDGYDLRLTIHHGHAVGMVSGSAGRFSIAWEQVKELRLDFFKIDDRQRGELQQSLAYLEQPQGAIPTMTNAEAQSLSVATIKPKAAHPNSITATTPIDMVVLFTEAARRQAGGNPAVCSDTAGVVGSIPLKRCHSKVETDVPAIVA